jgi:hypothetical protein
MWVIGGTAQDGGSLRSADDAWYSSDGQSWFKKTDAIMPYTGVSGGGCAIFDGRMWLFGDQAGAGWFTPDGTNWTTAGIGSDFYHSRRTWFGCAAFNGAVWITGGSDSSDNVGDVWRLNAYDVSRAAGWERYE